MPTFSGHAREKGGQEQLTYTCWQVVKLCLLPGCRALVALSLLPSPAAVLLLLAPHFKCVCGPLKLCERFTFPFDRSIPSGFSFSQALTFQPSRDTKHRAPSSIGYARRLHTQHRKIRRRRRTPHTTMTTTRRRTTTTMAASAALVLLLQLQDAGSFLLPTAPTMERSSRCSGSSHGWMATAHTAGPATRLYHSPKTSAAPTTVTGVRACVCIYVCEHPLRCDVVIG